MKALSPIRLDINAQEESFVTSGDAYAAFVAQDADDRMRALMNRLLYLGAKNPGGAALILVPEKKDVDRVQRECRSTVGLANFQVNGALLDRYFMVKRLNLTVYVSDFGTDSRHPWSKVSDVFLVDFDKLHSVDTAAYWQSATRRATVRRADGRANTVSLAVAAASDPHGFAHQQWVARHQDGYSLFAPIRERLAADQQAGHQAPASPYLRNCATTTPSAFHGLSAIAAINSFFPDCHSVNSPRSVRSALEPRNSFGAMNRNVETSVLLDDTDDPASVSCARSLRATGKESSLVTVLQDFGLVVVGQWRGHSHPAPPPIVDYWRSQSVAAE